MLAYTLAYPAGFRGLAGLIWGLAGALRMACNAGQAGRALGMPVFTVLIHSAGWLHSMAKPSPG